MAEISFKRRVEQFWNWFAQNAQTFFDTIEAGNCADLADPVSAKMNALLPGFVWVFGPGPDSVGGHSFTVSGNGDLNFQFLTEYWKAQAPDLGGWTFYASRQPGQLDEEVSFRFGDLAIKFGETFFAPVIQEQSERVDIVLFSPLFAQADENLKMTIAFVVLDEVLGEYGTEQWIGSIQTVHEQPQEALPLLKLRDFLHDLEIKYRWQKLPPTESATLYQRKEDFDTSIFPRSDIIFGSTTHYRLAADYLDSKGELEDPIAGTGADFVFVEFSSSVLPAGEEVDFRSQISDEVDALLRNEKSGMEIGGAFGTNNSYVDFLLVDAQAGLKTISDYLAKRDFDGGCAIHFFASNKRDRRVVV